MLNVSRPPPPYCSGAASAQSPAAFVLDASRSHSSGGSPGASGSSRCSSGMISSRMKRRTWSRRIRSSSGRVNPGKVKTSGPSGAAGDGRGLGNVERRDPAQLAAELLVLEGARAMHRGPVVPDHQIADAPGVAIDELPLGGVLDEIAEQEPPFGQRPPDDAGGVRGHIERAAARARERAHQGVDRALQLLLLALGELEAQGLA